MLNYLERFFMYRFEKLANSYGYLVIIWNEYGLAISSVGETLEIAIDNLKREVELNKWN